MYMHVNTMLNTAYNARLSVVYIIFMQSIEESIEKAPLKKKHQVPSYTPAVPSIIAEQSLIGDPIVPLRTVTYHQLKHTHRLENLELLQAELTKENYCEKYHQLLCREEEEHDNILSTR